MPTDGHADDDSRSLIMKLTDRQKSEIVFFDCYANEVDIDKLAALPLFSQYAFENRYIIKALGKMDGLRVIDLGCGWCEDGVCFAEWGARVLAIDLSEKMLSLAQQMAARKGVRERIQFVRVVGEFLPFDDNSVDIVFGRGTLHHLDMVKTMREVYRVLKPGGIACFSEPLADNPVLTIYRILNRAIRSPMEKPLYYRDLALIREVFDKFEHREFKLLAMIVLVWYYLKTKLTGTFYTGWFRALDNGLACRRAYSFFQELDAKILRVFPWLKRWCWLTVIVGRKD